MLSEQGYYRPTYEDILATKIQKAKELFGEDIETSEQTPLGKFIRIGAHDLSKAYEDLEMVYYARFPNTATGVSLDRLCVFAGISRNTATQAQHVVKVYSTSSTDTDTNIGIGELVVCGEDSDITFYSANTYTVPANGGSVNVVVECAESGEIGNVNRITEIVNPIAEIDRIEYVGIEKAGEESESDYDLRLRFASAIAGAGSANINAIRSALLRVPTVVSASVIANETDTEDAKGRPPRSFECFVYGGEDYEQEIAEAIFEKAPIGIKTCSTSTTPVVKTVLDDGGYEHTIRFSHTEEIPIYVSVKYKKNSKFENDGETQIKNNLVKYIDSLGVGADVILSSLYGHIYDVVGVVDVTEIKLSTNGTSYSSNNISFEDWQVAQITPTNITLSEVTA